MEEWALRRLVISGKSRKEVFKSLSERPKIAKEIANDTKLLLSNVNRIIKEFEAVGLIKNLTPNEKRNRAFCLTNSGKKITKELNKRNML